MLLALMGLPVSGGPAHSADNSDWITAMPREPVRVDAWPGGRKVAVCFVLYVEVWGYGRGPNFCSDMINRDPDLVYRCKSIAHVSGQVKGIKSTDVRSARSAYFSAV